MSWEQRAVDEEIERENAIRFLNNRLDYLAEKIEQAEALGLNTARLLQRFEETSSELYDVENGLDHG